MVLPFLFLLLALPICKPNVVTVIHCNTIDMNSFNCKVMKTLFPDKYLTNDTALCDTQSSYVITTADAWPNCDYNSSTEAHGYFWKRTGICNGVTQDVFASVFDGSIIMNNKHTGTITSTASTTVFTLKTSAGKSSILRGRLAQGVTSVVSATPTTSRIAGSTATRTRLVNNSTSSATTTVTRTSIGNTATRSRVGNTATATATRSRVGNTATATATRSRPVNTATTTATRTRPSTATTTATRTSVGNTATTTATRSRPSTATTTATRSRPFTATTTATRSRVGNTATATATRSRLGNTATVTATRTSLTATVTETTTPSLSETPTKSVTETQIGVSKTFSPTQTTTIQYRYGYIVNKGVPLSTLYSTIVNQVPSYVNVSVSEIAGGCGTSFVNAPVYYVCLSSPFVINYTPSDLYIAPSVIPSYTPNSSNSTFIIIITSLSTLVAFSVLVGITVLVYHRSQRKRLVNLRPVEQKTVIHVPQETPDAHDLLSRMWTQFAQEAEIRSSNPMKFAPVPVPAIPKPANTINTMDTQSVRNLIKIFHPNGEERRRSASFNLPPPPPFDDHVPPPPPPEDDRMAYPPIRR